ncbi:MAG: hypothetical protein ACUVUU_04885 [bacterium]
MQAQTDANAIGLVISNYGFFGNNLITRSPSMEYPLGSGIEHLVRAGLWVGGINADGDTVVSTGCVSGRWQEATEGASEFTPADRIKERSILITSRAYSEDAISEQDFVCSYTDFPKRLSTQEQLLQISVRQETYCWGYRFAEAFAIASFTIKNENPEGNIRNVYLGIFAELCSGWKNQYDSWPPPGSSWFRKKQLEYFPDLMMIGEHHYSYDRGNAPSWGAIAILGWRARSDQDARVSFNWWDWYWERDNPLRDRDRYGFMSNGEIDATDNILPDRDDPIELIAVGPFTELSAGDSIVFVCAFVGGMDRESLIANVEWAKKAFENDYILPSPPQPPLFKIEPGRGRIDIYWNNYPEDKEDPYYKVPDFEGYRIYITRVPGALTGDYNLVRELDVIDGIGYDTGFESVRIEGDSAFCYKTTISSVKDGFKYWVAITSFDRGMPEEGVESMESGVFATKTLVIPGTQPGTAEPVIVFPNPYRGEAVWDGVRDREKYIWFANLPGKATIRIFTLAGDLVKTIEFDADTYDASDIRGLNTSSERSLALPGGICAWDLITDKDQAVASGLYIFAVEDKLTGANQTGKFLVIR